MGVPRSDPICAAEGEPMQAAPQGFAPLLLGGAGGPGPRGHPGVPVMPVLPAGDDGYRARPAGVQLALHCQPPNRAGSGLAEGPPGPQAGVPAAWTSGMPEVCWWPWGAGAHRHADARAHAQTHTPSAGRDTRTRSCTHRQTHAHRQRRTGTRRRYRCSRAHPTAHTRLQIHQHVHPQTHMAAGAVGQGGSPGRAVGQG